jgi:endonuclease G
MHRTERVARLKAMLRQIEPETDWKSVARAPSGLEGLERLVPTTERAVDKVLRNGDSDLSDEEIQGLEAIVLKKGRPVVFIRNGVYDDLPDPWKKLNAPAIRNRIQPLFNSIGRVDLPNGQVPYGGTGFVVGPNLLMTNRHVAALFTVGLGRRSLRFTVGDAAIDFKREIGTPDDDRSAYIEVKGVAMIHPYWDMALVRVEGLPRAANVLRLSVERPEDLFNRDVIVIGYPALDPRNDIPLQNQIFEGKFEVKRLQPGKLRKRASIRSFENTVSAATHDSSTLGGNSGSAVIDVATGEVVALHFAGQYLKANYCVPTFELARDPRVVELELNFSGRVAATGDFDQAWARVDDEAAPRPNPDAGLQSVAGGAATWTIPVQVTISLGAPTLGGPDTRPPAAAAPAAIAAVEAKMQVPVIYPDLEERPGYRPDFLKLPGGEEVPLPSLTASGKSAAAKLEGGITELKYHHFSVVLHKKRRLAIFAASNVDWREESRTIDGRKPTRRELTELDDNAQERWVTDPRLAEAVQLPDVFYTKDGGAFDKGHIVRRDDVAWGKTFEDIQKANGDTYHTTNCSPQVAGFNRAAADDNWGDLEKLIQRETGAERVCIFAGPVLHEDDRVFSGRNEHGPVEVQIPRAFWKIVVAADEDGPKAYGFVLEQDLSDVPLELPLEFAVPQPWKRYMQSIGAIEEMLNGWVKLTWLKEHDAIESEEGRRIATAAEKSGR